MQRLPARSKTPRVSALLTALFALWVTVGMVRIAERGVRVEQLLLVSSCRSLDRAHCAPERCLNGTLPEAGPRWSCADWAVPGSSQSPQRAQH